MVRQTADQLQIDASTTLDQRKRVVRLDLAVAA